MGEQGMWEHKPTGECFRSFLETSQNFHKCFYNSTETWKTCFLFVLENAAMKKETTCLFWLSIQNVDSLCSLHPYVNSLCLFCVSIKFQYKSTSLLSQTQFSDWLGYLLWQIVSSIDNEMMVVSWHFLNVCELDLDNVLSD